MTERHAWSCNPGRTQHLFDAYSGWCVYGCGNRDDGRVVDRSGNVLIPGPPYSQAELDEFRERHDANPRNHIQRESRE